MKMKLSIMAIAFAVLLVPLASALAESGGTILYVERFSTDPSMADSERKKERIEEIPESKLIQIQETICSEVRKTGMFSEVILLRAGEKPTPREGRRVWVLGGQFLDYKKGSQTARYLIGFGAGKQKVDVMVELRNAANGETIRTERIVDRKVGGIFGGDTEKGLKDFAERIIEFLKGVNAPPAN